MSHVGYIWGCEYISLAGVNYRIETTYMVLCKYFHTLIIGYFYNGLLYLIKKMLLAPEAAPGRGSTGPDQHVACITSVTHTCLP